MHKLSIKKTLLIYSFFIQLIILIVFSYSLYKALDLATFDKLKTFLRVIILDVTDDILEHKNTLDNLHFNEENEYKFEPLYFRLLKLESTAKTIGTSNFPKDIISLYENLKSLKKDTITFESQNRYVISRIKIEIENSPFIIEIATSKSHLNDTLDNFLYILFFIVPIVLILATFGGYFLIYKSFLPVDKILMDLKEINAKDLSKRLKTLGNNDEIDLLSQEINSLLGRLEISFDKISQFSSDASHELKTPLTIIRGEIEVGLRKERTVDEYKEILENTLEEVLIIKQTIDDLLFLAKSEEPLHVSTDELIYLDEVSLEAISELKSFAKLQDVDIEYDIQDAMQIQGHSKLLKVAIKNILKNAILFSHKNGRVIVKNYMDGEKCVISIQDFGIGIAGDEQKKIFEKFYRTDKSRNKNSGGTGLGMAICEKIVKLHNGVVKLQSKENEGTTVTFVF